MEQLTKDKLVKSFCMFPWCHLAQVHYKCLLRCFQIAGTFVCSFVQTMARSERWRVMCSRSAEGATSGQGEELQRRLPKLSVPAVL